MEPRLLYWTDLPPCLSIAVYSLEYEKRKKNKKGQTRPQKLNLKTAKFNYTRKLTHLVKIEQEIATYKDSS